MKYPHSEGESDTNPKHDLACLMTEFLCNATSDSEIKSLLRLIDVHIMCVSPQIIQSIRERIELEPNMSSKTKEEALQLIDGELALRRMLLHVNV